ncbi:MAG: molybdopterin molybdotransferase MoeA [Alphaproteobacteria bacterium]
MISVEDARERILAALPVLPGEQVGLLDAFGRVLAEDVVARRSQPPQAVSAMDGYAVRVEDVSTVPASLAVVGEAPAGRAYTGAVAAGEAVRIFTGGPVPDGADTIVIQEDTDREGDTVVVRESAAAGKFIRAEGLDFAEGEALLSSGSVVTARDVGLAAAMNRPWLMVRRRPRVAILATGDEIVMPGDPAGPYRIVSSNALALAAAVRTFGGDPVLLGIAKDRLDALHEAIAAAKGADLLVTTGGASVGDHDLVQEALGSGGLKLDFWRIAMRPGKPLMFGDMAETPVLGLPGNPVSTLVCALVFLKPAMEKLLGLPADTTPLLKATLTEALQENDKRQDYLRSTLDGVPGDCSITPFERQDSSMLSRLAKADALIVRKPFAPALDAGATVDYLPMPSGLWRL